MFSRFLFLLALPVLFAACGATGTTSSSAPTRAEATSIPAPTRAASATTPASESQAKTVAVLVRQGGIDGETVTTTVTLDQVVISSQSAPMAVSAEQIQTLQSQLEATGIFDVPPGNYMPDEPCCDRYTYQLTLFRNDKSYSYTTMDDTPSAPQSLFEAMAAIDDFAAQAQQPAP